MKRYIYASLVGALTLWPVTGPVQAGNDFTFKRVKPPSSSGPRITVQISPEDRPVRPTATIVRSRPEAPPQVETAVAMPPSGGPAREGAGQEWFWTSVSPAIGAQAGRFLKAAQIAARPPSESGVRAPSLKHLQRIAQTYGDDILRHSVGTRVSPALVLALISVESAGKVDALSHAGAQGLMQLIPATAERFGVRDVGDPGQNIRGGVAYLDWLMKEFGNDPVLALAGYNAGEGAVKHHEGVPPYKETRAYVPKVLAAWNVARLMCTTPPTMPGDGCVFSRAFDDS